MWILILLRGKGVGFGVGDPKHSRMFQKNTDHLRREGEPVQLKADRRQHHFGDITVFVALQKSHDLPGLESLLQNAEWCHHQ